MQWDDEQPKPKVSILVGEPLTPLSIAELETRVLALGAEIERSKQEIEHEKKHQATAASLFK